MLFMYLVCIFTCIYIYIIFWFIMFGLILKLNYLSFLKNSLVPVTVWGTCSFYLQNSQECGLRPRTRKIKVVRFFVTFYSSSKGTGNLKKKISNTLLSSRSTMVDSSHIHLVTTAASLGLPADMYCLIKFWVF